LGDQQYNPCFACADGRHRYFVVYATSKSVCIIFCALATAAAEGASKAALVTPPPASHSKFVLAPTNHTGHIGGCSHRPRRGCALDSESRRDGRRRGEAHHDRAPEPQGREGEGERAPPAATATPPPALFIAANGAAQTRTTPATAAAAAAARVEASQSTHRAAATAVDTASHSTTARRNRGVGGKGESMHRRP